MRRVIVAPLLMPFYPRQQQLLLLSCVWHHSTRGRHLTVGAEEACSPQGTYEVCGLGQESTAGAPAWVLCYRSAHSGIARVSQGIRSGWRMLVIQHGE
jgi:hypothetical protein